MGFTSLYISRVLLKKTHIDNNGNKNNYIESIVDSLLQGKNFPKNESIIIKKPPLKKFFSIFVSFILILVIIASASIFTNRVISDPINMAVSLDPEIIRLNETMKINVSIPFFYNISHVEANVSGIEIIDLEFKNSSSDPQWSGFWQCKDLQSGDYIVTITAFENENKTYNSEIKFSILSQNESISSTNETSVQNSTIIGQQNPTINPLIDNTNETSIIIDLNNTNNISYENDNKNISIVDPADEQVFILPGTTFYVERTINGRQGLRAIFAPIFSDGLKIEKIEIIKQNSTTEKIIKVESDSKPKKFSAGQGESIIEKRIDVFRDKLPSRIRKLEKVSYSNYIDIDGPVTVRAWFIAPSWEEIKSGEVPTFGHISYLTFAGDNYDFESSTWWNANWSNRKLITLNSSQVEEDLTNFPVLINITDTDLINDAQNDGDDIAFVLYSDNTTKLNHEIELFNSTTGNLLAWVNITSLSSSVDTKIWMFYYNSICTSQQNVEGTWDDNHVMIQHLNETSGTHLDSTSNNNDDTSKSVNIQGSATGQIDGADDFDDTNTNYVTFTTSSMLTSAGTISLWGNMDSSTGTRSYFFSHRTGSNNNRIYIYEQSGTLYVGFANVFQNNIGYTINPDEWHLYTLTWSGASWNIYVDSNLEGGSSSATLTGIDANCHLGSYVASNEWFDGIIDEVRVSNIPRNTSWINTSYNTMKNMTTFISIGGAEKITNTSVDNIYPYNISYSPLTITATGADGLDNVTLWYRYSSDNNSWDVWVQNITDTISPWSWSFSFPNGTGYYEFYSIGNISGYSDETAPSSADAICYFNASINTPPTIELITPSPNGTTGISTLPICQIWANDSDSSTLDVYWLENSTGSYILRNTNNSISANTTVSYTFSEFSNYSTSYWWKVAVNDSEDNISAIYYFTTLPIGTSVEKISPYNISSSPLALTASGPSDLDNVTLWYRWSTDNITWGTKTISIFEDFESGSQNTSLWNTYQTPAGDARIQWNYGTAHSGSYSCSMDDADTDPGDSALNVIYTNYDFTGATDINIDFWQREWGDEPEDAPNSWTGWGNYDVVAYTNDGNTWYEIVPESNLNIESFTNYQYNISADPDFSSPPNSNFAIAFQQYDNYQLTSDGRAWDDIYLNFTINDDNSTNWIEWNNVSNPDTGSPWGWSFDFPNGTGYYEFYSIGNKSGSPDEAVLSSADAICNYVPPTRPIVITNISSGVEENNATFRGYLSSDGGLDTTCGFRYGIGSGFYSENFSVGIVSNTSEFSNNNGSLSQGQIYFYQAWANNSIGFANGSELIFLTKPEAPSGLTAQSNSTSMIYLNWNNGMGSNNTYIERNASGVSVWDRGSGIVIYNGSGTSFEDSGLVEGVTYYYQAWSYANWSYDSNTLFQWSDANASENNKTHDRPKIDLVNPSPNGTTGESILPICQIWANDSDSSTLNIYWFENSTGSYILRNTNSSVSANSLVSYNFNEFSNYSATYYWKVVVNDSTYNTSKWFYFSTQLIDTSIDTIVPYIVTYSPYNLTVSDYSDLDKITLWYQYSTDNVSWSGWMENTTDTVTPWKWSFTFSNGTGYYEFYSIGNKTGSPNETVPGSTDAICHFNVSVNNPSTQSNEYPANQSTGIDHTPQLSVAVDDGDLDTLNATWYSNSSGSWVQFGSNLSIDTSGGSVNIIQTNSNFSDYEKTFWWSVNLTDGIVWTNETYYFTTASINTSIDDISPYIIENINPLSVSASGPSDLNNVTLWYHYSLDNSSWWNATWGYRKNITFNSSQIKSNLSNFPVLINITDNNLSVKAQSNGYDIVFTNATGTKLNHEIELYNSTIGQLIAWVNVTSLSSTADTLIWMYYGNSICSDQQNIAGTWNDNYIMVHHCNETPPNGVEGHIDSTNFDNNGTPQNFAGSPGSTTDASGIVDGADDFDGTDDYIECGLNNMPDTDDPVTLEAWARYSSNPGTENLILINDQSSSAIQLGFRGNAVNTWLWGGTSIVSSSLPGANLWHYYVFTTDGTNHILYVDGTETDSSSVALQSGTTSEVRINTDAWGEDFDGLIDEARISNIPRNASWIETCFNNQYNQSTFINIGNEDYWIEWSDASNPDNIYPWNWSFNFPNGIGYYEFYSIGNKSGSPNETTSFIADTRCHLIENTTIEITPSQWNPGIITIGSFVNTTGNYFKLTNNGTVSLNIQIKASNATNVTTGAQWNLTSIPGNNNYSLQYNKSSDLIWTNINLTYDTFVTNLATSSWENFDIKLIMATSSTKGDPLSLTITFRSVAS